ncbi:U3 small nucleolar RNA-associated protein 15 [Microbotryomycetes sp. JL221]|nr:U3 small nucleolar RNA-associated protein 15 [Microbotryomycetes sp. JL221]
MSEFSRLVVPKAPKTTRDSHQHSESTYWKSFKASTRMYQSNFSLTMAPVFLKSYAPITHIQFSPASPHRYVVTSGTRLQIYSPKTNRVVKTISRFKDTATSGEIRSDGKLCVAGDEAGLVQVFDINSRAILRTIRAHKQTVHTTKFSPGAGTQVLTTSSDTTVRLFDLSTSAQLRSFQSHTDYVRTASFVPTSPSLVLSGGYDGTVRLWDARVEERGGEVWLGRHGKPVEDVIVSPTGTMAVSAGGPIVRVWDLLGASSSASTSAGSTDAEGEIEDTGTQYCVKALSNHQKTIMKLCWTESENGEARVLSGGLDGLVKVYDPQDNWRVRHTMRYGGQIMSLAVSPNSSHLIAGLSDGSLSIRTRLGAKKAGLPKERVTPSFDALLAGAGHGGIAYTGKEAAQGLKATFEGEVKVGRERKRKLQEWDRLLKDFRYGDALDSVMRRAVTPATTFALLEELMHRDGLTIALSNRHDASLEPILKFLVKHVTNPRYGVMACDVATVLIEIYTPVLGLSPLIDGLLTRLRRRVDEELAFHKELIAVRGALDMVFACSQHSLTVR